MKRFSSLVQYSFWPLLLATPVTLVGQATPPHSPYTSMEGRPIKALSEQQIAGLETGQGMGLALAAELNGYPGPKHVLELQTELGLTESQIDLTQDIFQAMKESAVDLGRQIVAQERELDRLFVSHAIDPESLTENVLGISELQAQLRAAHLQAHLEMMEVLDEDQIRKYIELRGYHTDPQGHHPAGGHGKHH